MPRGRNLEKADLTDANLWLADFIGARGLDKKQIKSGKNWSLALMMML